MAFVYANSRAHRLPAIAAGVEPDTSLLGQNHLFEHGIDATIVEPWLQRLQPRNPALARLAWNARELSLPWEVGDANVLCTTIGPLVALAARIRPRVRTVLFNLNLCNRLQRASSAQRTLLTTAIRSADAIVCFADAQRARLLDLIRLEPASVHVCALGVDERFLRAERSPSPEGHVLAVGRDLARDYETFAAAVTGLPASVVLVASTKNLTGVRLPPNVDVRLDTSPVELRRLYEQARCVVVPTRRESFPYGADCSGQTVVLDSFAMARACVVSARSTLKGYAEDAVNALVVPAEDATSLRRAIDRLLAQPDFAAELGAAGRNAVERQFTTRRLAARLVPIVESVRTGRR